MQGLPPINWRLAHRVALPFSGELPQASRAEAHAVAASLRLAGARAGDLVARTSQLPGCPAQHVVVCDRDHWARSAGAMAGGLLGGLPLAKATGPIGAVKGAGYGVLAGAALGWVGRKLLGQFDPSASRLYLVAPNILHLQRARKFVPADFHLWVASHEQTHAIQFSSAPWLLEHLTRLLTVVANDEVGALHVARNLARGQGLEVAMSSPEAHRALQEVTATMTLLEGHADFISDRVGPSHIPSVRRLRAAFTRSHAPTALARLAPALDKDAQYRDGLRFCRAVAARVGVRGLSRAFESPENLPRLPEIGDPRAWLRRVHGTT